MINKDYTFTVTGADGKEVLCDTMAVINREEEEKNPLIIYTDYTKDETGKFALYVSELKQEGEGFVLGDVDEETYKNIPKVREALDKIWEMQEEQ